MSFFSGLQNIKKNQKSKKQLEQHYESLELEKGDLLAMFIAAFITFGPLIIIITALLVGIAYIFGA